MKKRIPFNKTFITGKESGYISRSVKKGEIEGGGVFARKCEKWLENVLKTKKAYLTNSCTAGMEMAALLMGVKRSHEILMPSFTFTSTANAFLLRGAVPVFIDIREDTLNINEDKIEERISEKTKAICPVHYAGIGCEMEKILKIARKNHLLIVEDAAHAAMARYKKKYLGTIGDIGVYSFHNTKNISSGEGGAILINNLEYIERAEVIREKGTNRNKFLRGEVDKYEWVDIGSSFLVSEIIAAYLYAQLEKGDMITKKRVDCWNNYYHGLKNLGKKGDLTLPSVPAGCRHNGHIFYLLTENRKIRDALKDHLSKKGIQAVFHYVPLHLSPMGKSLGYREGQLKTTESISKRMLRLPLYPSLSKSDQQYIIKAVKGFF
ncbi:dTDP-4-amino-4,6-dideoxygalactose transaminase [Fibrobacterota bacterium]